MPADVVRDPRALLVVVRDDAEEVPAAASRPSVRLVRVADPETNPSPPRLSGAVETCTSWLPAGPTTPRICEFDASRSATWIAWAVSGSCVSPTTARNFVRRCDLLYRVTQ